MKQGDFTALAKDYINRPGYSDTVLRMLSAYTGALNKCSPTESFLVADVGAGTGKLTELLLKMQLQCIAIEPNEAMRLEGQKSTRQYDVRWQSGSGEATGLDSESVNWVLMASSFHWVDLEKGLREFSRILKPGGYFTALWNPRDLQRSEFHQALEEKIYSMIPDIQRVSSGSSKYTRDLHTKLLAYDLFENCIFVEAEHEVIMSKERFVGAWRSVNDIQSQAGPETFARIIQLIENEISEMEHVVVPYKTRAWTVTRKN